MADELPVSDRVGISIWWQMNCLLVTELEFFFVVNGLPVSDRVGISIWWLMDCLLVTELEFLFGG